ADAITVMRRGTTVANVTPQEVTARRLAELMVGSALPVPELRESAVTDRVVLDVAGLSVAGQGSRPVLDGISLTIHAGEVLGIAGVEGNGQAELVDALMGIRPLAAGRISVDGRDITRASTRSRRAMGMGYIPEDRHRQGLLLEASLWENRILGHQTRPPNVRGFLLHRRGAREDTPPLVRE